MWRRSTDRRRSILMYAEAVKIVAVLLIGCSGPSTKPQAPPAQQPAKQAPVSAPTRTVEAPKVEQAPEPVFTYNPAGRRDPFAPLIVKEEATAGKRGDINRPPLERYDIKEFKLTGILWGGFGYNALLEGPDGKGYFIRVGTILGPNRGVVKKITQHSIVIEEKYKNYLGETERKEIIVELPKKQEGIL